MRKIVLSAVLNSIIIRVTPTQISHLKNLEELVLLNNEIDTINPVICQCTSLKKLFIGGKSLQNLPSCLSQMPNLEKLVIQSDSINNFMDEFKVFTQLKELTLFTYDASVRNNRMYRELQKSLPATRFD